MINGEDLKIGFENLFKDINIPTKMKDKLLKDAFSNHYIYTFLPSEISKLVREKASDEKIIQLSFYSYLYFTSVLYYDKFIDNQLTNTKEVKSLTFFLFFIKEKAILGLASLFNIESEFWGKFEELKNTYFTYSDSSYIANVQNPNNETYFELAKNKGILTHNYVYSVKYLFGNIKEMDRLIKGIDCFSIGVQIYDDYKDIKEDYNNKQPNYLIFKITNNKDFRDRSFEYLHKLAFLNNTIAECLDDALNHLIEAKNIFEDLKIQLLLNKTIELIDFIKSEKYFIEASIIKAKDKSKKSNTLSPYHNIKNVINLSLDFIENNLNENNLWKDFMTNAGYGQEWVTGYILTMLGEVNTSIPFLEKSLSSLLKSTGSYNEYIVQDGDSTNFLLKALNIFNQNVPNDLISNWLNFSKAEGGWVTYYDDDIKRCMNFPMESDFSGWFSSKFCVSAVSAWVAKDFKNNTIISEKYFKTINFLVKNQNEDGSWSSYWWTENIYATAFCILSFPNFVEHRQVLKDAVLYLIKKQNKNGSWNNSAIESTFYTAISIKALIHYYLFLAEYKDNDLNKIIQKGVNWLLQNQMLDGSWRVSRILRIPSPDIIDATNMNNLTNTSFGLNCLVDDHNRVFTTATIYNILSLYLKFF